jgi:hypothetical protein
VKRTKIIAALNQCDFAQKLTTHFSIWQYINLDTLTFQNASSASLMGEPSYPLLWWL